MNKPSLIIGKKQIILSCLTLMLAVAVYVNYVITKDSVDTSPISTAELKGNVSYGDTEFVNASSADSSKDDKTKKEDKDNKDKEGSSDKKNAEDIPTEKAEGQSAEEYFAQARLERTASRDESVAALQSVMGSGDRTDDELITDAIAAVETSKLIENESNIESIVKSMGYSDCIVYLDSDSAKVVVRTDGLDSAQAAAIKDVILGEITIPAENIRLFEVR